MSESLVQREGQGEQKEKLHPFHSQKNLTHGAISAGNKHGHCTSSMVGSSLDFFMGSVTQVIRHGSALPCRRARSCSPVSRWVLRAHNDTHTHTGTDSHGLIFDMVLKKERVSDNQLYFFLKTSAHSTWSNPYLFFWQDALPDQNRRFQPNAEYGSHSTGQIR